MKEYRKLKGKDTWHFCKNCSNWPTSNYDSSFSKPTVASFVMSASVRKQLIIVKLVKSRLKRT